MTKRGRITSLALMVAAATGLGGCTGSPGEAVPAGASSTLAPLIGQHSPASTSHPASLHFTAASTLAEYPARSTLDATTCDAPGGPWTGTLRINQEYLDSRDRVRTVNWTFDSAGRAVLVTGRYRGRVEGKSYTASFVVRMHLSGTSEVTVDDVAVRQTGQADTSLRPYMTGPGVATPLTRTTGHC